MVFFWREAVKRFEFSNSASEIVENIGIPRPPSFGGKDKSFLSFSERVMPPVIAGISSICTISSICCKYAAVFGTVRII